MRLRVPLLVLALTTFLFVLPHTVLAQSVSIPFFGPIVPDSINKCAANWATLIDIINRIIAFSITMAIVFIAPLMIAYSGFLYVVNPVNPGGRAQANNILLNTIVGIVIAMAGWMIVDAIMAVLYKPDPSQGFVANWSAIITGRGDPCLIQEGALQRLNQGALVTGSSATGGLTVVPPSTAPASETAIRQQFANAGVQINHSVPCNPYTIDGVVNRCTNVGGMLPSTVAQVIAIKNACGSGCAVMVTGGSEAGHASGAYSHGTGYKVDLNVSPVLDSYLQSMTSIGTRTGDSSGPAFTDRCNGNNQYVKESTHWDITIYSTCAPPK